MEIIIQPDQSAAIRVAAQVIARVLKEKPNAVLGLATGSSPVLLYRQLIDMKLDWSQVRSFNLDEYVGLPPTHSQSYHHFMQENLFKHVNIRPENTHIPDGQAKDIPGFCQDYEKKIADAGGIDLQILGIGTDGHIAFNEPSSSLVSRTRIKTLTPETRRDNARFFESEADVPMYAITMGVGTIMEARKIVLLAFGENKTDAVAGALEGPVSSSNTASILQMHPDARFYLDPAAAGGLKRADYYRWLYDNKPDWQRP